MKNKDILYELEKIQQAITEGATLREVKTIVDDLIKKIEDNS